MLSQELRASIAKVDLSFSGEGGNLDAIIKEASGTERNLREVMQFAAGIGNIEVVKGLIEAMPDITERKKIIFADDCLAFRNAAEIKNIRIIGLLLRAVAPTTPEYRSIIKSGGCEMLNPIDGRTEVAVFFAVMLGKMLAPPELGSTLTKSRGQIDNLRKTKESLIGKFCEVASSSSSSSSNSSAQDDTRKLANRKANDAIATLLTAEAGMDFLSRGQKQIVSRERDLINSILDSNLSPTSVSFNSSSATLSSETTTGKRIGFGNNEERFFFKNNPRLFSLEELDSLSQEELELFSKHEEGDDQQPDVFSSSHEDYEDDPSKSVSDVVAEEFFKDNALTNSKTK